MCERVFARRGARRPIPLPRRAAMSAVLGVLVPLALVARAVAQAGECTGMDCSAAPPNFNTPCDSLPLKCRVGTVCQAITKVCKPTSEPCSDPKPCPPPGDDDGKFKNCVASNMMSNPRQNFDCLADTEPPTPKPTPMVQGAPTPKPMMVEGDVCKLEEALCTTPDFGKKDGCPCMSMQGLGQQVCEGSNVKGKVLGCNRATSRCAFCSPGELYCTCMAGGTCQAGLACQDNQCDPTSAFSISCASNRGIGCPCDNKSVFCRPDLACSSLVSRCVGCPRGCEADCAMAAAAEDNAADDPCAVHAKCETCAPSGECLWCADPEAGGRCRSECSGGIQGRKVCPDCTIFKTSQECNGGGACTGKGECSCRSDFVSDPELGCKPSQSVATKPMEPAGGTDIAVIAGGAAGGAVVVIVVIVLIVCLVRRANATDEYAVADTNPYDGTGSSMDMAMATGMADDTGTFVCQFCQKTYNFQSDLDTHTQLRHGAGGGGGQQDFSGTTFNNNMGYDQGQSFNGGSYNGGGMNPGNSFGGGGYANQGGTFNGTGGGGYDNTQGYGGGGGGGGGGGWAGQTGGGW